MDEASQIQLAAVAGAPGSALVLLARERVALLAGFVMLAVAKVGLGLARRLRRRPEERPHWFASAGRAHHHRRRARRLRRRDGSELWTTYAKRDLLRYESFYASASTDGKRLYTTSRAGKILALGLQSGSTIWTYQTDA